MVRKLFYFIALLLFSFACEQFPEQQPTGTVTFADGTSFTLQFEAEGGKKNIMFTADSDWTVSTSNEWINVSKTSGTLSDTSFVVEVEANDSFDTRDGYIEMHAANNKQYHFDIHQNGEQPTFQINGNGEYEVLANGGNVSVKIETNLEYTVQIPSSAQSWITLSDTRAVRKDTLTFVIAANNSLDERSARINIVSNDNNILQTIVIVQQGEDEVFTLDKASISVDENGGNIEIKVSTNLEYAVDIPTEAKSWLSVADTRTMRNETLVFTVLPNETLYAREALVSVSVSNGKKHSLKFTQKAMPLVFTIDKHYVLFDKDGGSVEVSVTSNIDYTISIDDANTSWLSYNKTRATTTNTITFNVTALAEGNIRNADVKFTDVSGNTLTTLNIEQDSSFIVAYTTNNGKPVDIYKTEGFGATYLGNNYNSDSNCGRLRFDAAITAIPEQAFALCSNLITIDIPNSVTSIGSSAFSGCSAMQEITIPESVTTVGTDAFINCSGKAYINCNMDTNWSTYTSLSFENAGFDEIVIGDNVEIIGYCTFRGASITELTLGKNVKEIRDHAFANNFYLQNLVIPDSVTTIGYWAFYGCASLTSITLGSGLTTLDTPNIGAGITSSLMLVYCKSVVPPTATGAIFGKTSNFTIYVPKDSIRDYKTVAYWAEYADCMVSYDYENNRVDDPNYNALPRDKWIGVWDMVSSQSMTIHQSGDIVFDNTPIKQEVSIAPHPSFSDEVLIYGLSAKNYPARAYVDENGVINMVNGMAVGNADADGYEPTWLIYYEYANSRGFLSEQMVSYQFTMNSDNTTATATPMTKTIDGYQLKVLSTEVYAVNPNTGGVAYYTSSFPLVYHAGELTLTRSVTRTLQSSAEPANLFKSHAGDVRVNSLESLR